MSFLIGFGKFWYDFVIGDDWTIAAGVVGALVVTNLLVRAHVTVWWLLPVVVVLFLWASMWRLSSKRS